MLERFRQVKAINESLAAISIGLEHIDDDNVRAQLLALSRELEAAREQRNTTPHAPVSALRRRVLELLERSMRHHSTASCSPA